MRHEYLHPARVVEAVQAWLERFNGSSERAAAGAASLYAEFQRIHPFADGNGRIGRLLLAYWLHWKHQAAFRFVAADRLEHLRAIEATGLSLKNSMEFLLSDGLMPESGLPVESLLALEDWVRRRVTAGDGHALGAPVL